MRVVTGGRKRLALKTRWGIAKKTKALEQKIHVGRALLIKRAISRDRRMGQERLFWTPGQDHWHRLLAIGRQRRVGHTI